MLQGQAITELTKTSLEDLTGGQIDSGEDIEDVLRQLQVKSYYVSCQLSYI